jgi:hypothetical protein
MIGIREVSRHDNTSVVNFGFDSRFHALELFFVFPKRFCCRKIALHPTHPHGK